MRITLTVCCDLSRLSKVMNTRIYLEDDWTENKQEMSRKHASLQDTKTILVYSNTVVTANPPASNARCFEQNQSEKNTL